MVITWLAERHETASSMKVRKDQEMTFLTWLRVGLSGVFCVVMSVVAIAVTAKSAPLIVKEIQIFAFFVSLLAIVVAVLGMIWS